MTTTGGRYRCRAPRVMVDTSTKGWRGLGSIAAALTEHPAHGHYGYDLSRAAGVRSGLMYAILRRMMHRGWIADGWQPRTQAANESRPPRRYYYVTQRGHRPIAWLARNHQERNR